MTSKHFKRGDLVVMSAEGLENENYAGYYTQTFRIESVANKYMPSKEFFARNQPEGYHPGYDEGAGAWLYDLKTVDGQSVPFSLYDWELRRA